MNRPSFGRVSGCVRPLASVFKRVVVKKASGEEGTGGERIVVTVPEREPREGVGVERVDPEGIRPERVVASEEGSEDLEGVDGVELPELVVSRPVGLARSADGSFGIAETVVAGPLVGVTQDIVGFGYLLIIGSKR